MKNTVYWVCFAGLAAMLVLTAMIPQAAAVPRPGQDNDASWQMLANFNEFLNAHPWIAKKLRENPTLVNNRDFLRDNHELRDWLEDHPEARAQFRLDPRGFMHRQRDFELYGRYQSGGDAKRAELARFHAFLDRHGEIREDLYKHPDRVRRPEYVAHHPPLRTFLENHPRVRQELQEDPRGFIDRLRDFERHEGDER